eukprot:TRINITY_DN136000_c0_g1_i1.p1 TRINITY_DN136000_c0_g1~~TRINITY_DN136000_c0_g1_i1.p1  ORF type:complete len:293 (-),score=20.60 TRINITY_DN136000_c0_g1_i1:49-927(-)
MHQMILLMEIKSDLKENILFLIFDDRLFIKEICPPFRCYETQVKCTKELCGYVSVSNRIFIIGGLASGDTYEIAILGSKYQSLKKANMLLKKGEFGTAVVHNKYIYVIGGIIDYSYRSTSDCQRYSIAEDRWIKIKPLVRSMYMLSTICINERYLYTFGGFMEHSVKTIQCMDLLEEDSGWKNIRCKNVERTWIYKFRCGLAQVCNNSVLLFGGSHVFDTTRTYRYNYVENNMKQYPAKLPSKTIAYSPAQRVGRMIFGGEDKSVLCLDPIKVVWGIVYETLEKDIIKLTPY